MQNSVQSTSFGIDYIILRCSAQRDHFASSHFPSGAFPNDVCLFVVHAELHAFFMHWEAKEERIERGYRQCCQMVSTNAYSSYIFD